MRNLLNPKWLLLIHTAPAIAALFSYLGLFQLIRSELNAQSTNAWYTFFGIFASISLGHLAYTIRAIRKKKPLDLYYGFVIVILYPGLLYFYFDNMRLLADRDLPNWLSAEQLPFYISTALMPTIFHGIYVLVRAYTPDVNKSPAWKSFLPALVVPLFWYLCVQVGLPAWQPLDSRFGLHVQIILLVLSTIFFLFLILRTVYIMLARMKGERKVFIQTWTIIFGILCPLAGLIINNGDSQWGIDPLGENVFGDFSNPWYLIIALVNGLALLFSYLKEYKARLLLFIIKSINISYVLYFFFVLLPYLPLSVILIIAFGLGVLMLSPTVLLLLQARSLLQDFDYLKNKFSPNHLWAILILGTLTLPTAVAINYNQDRKHLDRALTYVFENTEKDPTRVRPYALKRVLKNVRQHRRGGGIFVSNSTPLLTPLYNYLVLDNMTLPRYKIAMLEAVYFGEKGNMTMRNRPLAATNRNNEDVLITHVETRSNRSSEGHIESTLTLEITNNSLSGLSEFVTSFELPPGTFIDNYHLWIGDRKEPGILAEKKAATWLYQQIVSTRRDPGILYYGGGNRINFRIYPFEARQVRKTEITFIHQEPVKLEIDGQRIALGEYLAQPEEEPVIASTAAYLSTAYKETLPLVNRKPYFHFILDYSKRASDAGRNYLKQINDLGRQLPELLAGARVSQVNSYVQTTAYSPEAHTGFEFKAGFFLEKAIKKIMVEHYESSSASYPVIVVLSPEFDSAVFTKNLADYAHTFPESSQFYSLSPTGSISEHSLVQNPLDTTASWLKIPIEAVAVRLWKSPLGQNIYLPDDQQPSVVPLIRIEEGIMGKGKWQHALGAQGDWLNFRMGAKDHQAEWLALVKMSYEDQVMNPTTAFMALETESQKIMLKQKQEQVLKGKESLELGENVNRMSEPEWLLLLFLFPLSMLIRKLKSQS